MQLTVPLLRSLAIAAVLAGTAELNARGTTSAVRLYVAGEFARDTGDFRAATQYLAPALAAEPGDVVLRQRVFEASLQSGDIETAAKLAREILVNAPSDGQALLVLVVEAVRNQKWDVARKHLDGFSSAGVDGFLAPVLKCWVALGSSSAGDPAQFLQPLQTTPAYASFAAEQNAWLMLAQQKWEKADLQFKALLGPSGTEGSVRIRLAAAAAAQRANDPANVKSALGSEPDTSVHPWILRARQTVAAGQTLPLPIASASDAIAETLRRIALDLSREEGRTPAAGYAWLAARLSPGTPESLLTLADVLTAANQGGTALTLLESMPTDPLSVLVTNLSRARVLQTQNKAQEAIAILQTTVKAYPQRQDAWNVLGDLYRVQENHAASADAYSKAIALAPAATPADWSLYFVRGMAYERLKLWTQAEADFKQALALKPEQPSVLNYLGYSWLERRQNIPEATRMIERAVAQRPTDGAMIDSLGWAYFLKGDLPQAVARLEDALAAVPNDPTVNEHLGDAYLATGRELEALHRWQAALDAGPDAEQKARLVIKLDRRPPVAG